LRTLEDSYRAWSARRDDGEGGGDARRLRQFRRLAQHGVSTLADLQERWADLHWRTRKLAAELLGYTGDRRVVPLLTRAFVQEPALRSAVSTSLALLGGKRAYRFVRSHIERALASDTPDADMWASAFWALAWMLPERENAHDLLLAIFSRRDLPPRMRATAIEVIGCDLGDESHDDDLYVASKHAVLAALTDAEPEVRFDGVYAVGQMGLREALPQLRRMAQADRGGSPGLWTVAEEAQDVIEHLTTGHGPGREPDTGRVLDA